MNLSNYRDSGAFSDLEKLVLDYTVALTETPANASDELVEELRKHLGDDRLVELTATIAWENYRARFNRGFDVESQDFTEGAFCPIPEHR
jgi:alkylhydroperoxidase family enzyme